MNKDKKIPKYEGEKFTVITPDGAVVHADSEEEVAKALEKGMAGGKNEKK